MYPYHNRIIQRIKNGELVKVDLCFSHPTIGKCMLLYFRTYPYTRPIRYTAVYRYVDLLDEYAPSAFADGAQGAAQAAPDRSDLRPSGRT